MKLLAILLATSLLPAQTPVRRALAPSPINGWARVVVDDDGAQGVWIGDAQGRSVPFLWESDAKWSSIPLQTIHPAFGKDAQGHPTAAFTLRAPEGFARGDREQVKLDFALEASATPWTCRVVIARRGDGGAFIAMDDENRFLYDFGSDRRTTSVTIPWDADDYRVTLVPVQGEVPKLRGVGSSACTLPAELKADETRSIPVPSGKDRGHANLLAWFRISFTPSARITALRVQLKPPVAPIEAVILCPDVALSTQQIDAERQVGSGSLWNLPALNTETSLIALDGSVVSGLRLMLPDPVEVDSIKALIRHRRIFFPAEAGQAYFLHLGGLAKTAPGSLGELPASSRAFYTGTALALGPAELDDQAVIATPDPAARLRRLLPWAAGLVILLLGFWGLRLMRKPDGTDLH